MEESTKLRFYSRDPPAPEKTAEKTLKVCKGIEAIDVGSPDSQSPPDKIDLNPDGLGGMSLYWGEKSYHVNIGIGPDTLPDYFLSIKTFVDYLISDFEESNTGEYEGFLGTYIELVRQLAEELDPHYVETFSPHRDIRPSPTEVLPVESDFTLERLPWLGIYSEPLLDELGGKERVLNAPAWKVEELETGSVLMLKTRAPWGDVSREHPLDRYLLDGEDVQEQEAMSEERGLSDPFESFAPGELGADVVVDTDDLSAHFANDVLELRRCRVDDQHNLRDIETDEFVRRQFGDDGMIGEVPEDADPSTEMISALFQADIPPAFVRLEDPDDDNLVTKVMDLDIESSKFELLVTLGRVAQQDEFTEEELQTMETAIDKLSQIDDTEKVDQYIQEQFL